MKKLFFSTTILSSLIIGSNSYAANSAELEATVKQLQAQVEALQAQIKSIQPLLEEQKSKQESQRKRVISDRRLSDLEPAANYEPVMQGVEHVKPCDKGDCVKVSLKPGPVFESKDGTKSFGVHGFMQGDAAWFDDDAVDHPNGTTMRRMRLSLDGKFDDWGYKFESDFADNATRITDAYLEYAGFEHLTLRAGQYKEPFSLEELTSDRFGTFIERASPNALVPSRNIGLSAATGGDMWTLTAGVFGASTGDASSDDESSAVTARATIAPIAEPGKVLHFGAAGSYRKPDSATDAIQYRSRMETRIPTLQSVDTGAIAGVDDATLLGLEAAAVLNWFSVQGEYIQSDLDREVMPNATLDGYYVLASAILTGESRNYKKETGAFDRLTPNNPFNPSAGTWGAWEVATRYSKLDLTDGGVTGGEMDNYTFALNWYPHSNVRFMADYIIVDTDNEAVTPGDDPQVFTVRGQVDF